MSKIILPGQSRSTKCSTRTCRRLLGHKGTHRGTLTSSAKPALKTAVEATSGGVEVRSSDVYTVQPTAHVPAKAAKRTRRPKVVVIPMADYKRLVAAGHKVTKSRGYIVSGKPSARLA